ncbi:hypothetical protein BRADI_2g45352v3, partial [Brachypodium distachyon]
DPLEPYPLSCLFFSERTSPAPPSVPLLPLSCCSPHAPCRRNPPPLEPRLVPLLSCSSPPPPPSPMRLDLEHQRRRVGLLVAAPPRALAPPARRSGYAGAPSFLLSPPLPPPPTLRARTPLPGGMVRSSVRPRWKQQGLPL